ncbi:hypothetical protein N7535_004058 [Penicillium sp. DV-2018c]|nr:hypothetical protein N7535_004058 [Penicillium sp. DV-2018c]
MDVAFWARAMKKAGKTISDACAALFQIGCYHAVPVRLGLEPDDFDILVDVGFAKLVIPWEENTPEPQEYYSLFAPEGTDPLTVPLDTDLFGYPGQ